MPVVAVDEDCDATAGEDEVRRASVTDRSVKSKAGSEGMQRTSQAELGLSVCALSSPQVSTGLGRDPPCHPCMVHRGRLVQL